MAATSYDFKEARIVAEFNKLHQLGSSLDDYILKFEDLKSRMLSINHNNGSCFTEAYFVGSFISGLTEETQSFLELLEPQNLQQAVHLATNREQIIDALANKTSIETAPIKLLTSAEMKARVDRSLCHSCDEKFTQEHRCKNRQVFMLMTEHEEQEQEQEEDEAYRSDSQNANAKNVDNTHNNGVMMFKGKYGEQELRVKVVTGSLDSFVDKETAMKLGCSAVKLTIEGKTMSSCYATELTWGMEGLGFSHFPLRLVKLSGCHLILGADWLKKNSWIELNFKDREMSVPYQDHKIRIRAMEETNQCTDAQGAITGLVAPRSNQIVERKRKNIVR